MEQTSANILSPWQLCLVISVENCNSFGGRSLRWPGQSQVVIGFLLSKQTYKITEGRRDCASFFHDGLVLVRFCSSTLCVVLRDH